MENQVGVEVMEPMEPTEIAVIDDAFDGELMDLLDQGERDRLLLLAEEGNLTGDDVAVGSVTTLTDARVVAKSEGTRLRMRRL